VLNVPVLRSIYSYILVNLGLFVDMYDIVVNAGESRIVLCPISALYNQSQFQYLKECM
jgi:hypothetical protein